MHSVLLHRKTRLPHNAFNSCTSCKITHNGRLNDRMISKLRGSSKTHLAEKIYTTQDTEFSTLKISTKFKHIRVSWIQTHSPTVLVFSVSEDLVSALLEANFERGFLHEASCCLPTTEKITVFIQWLYKLLRCKHNWSQSM
jgi:hypothetical protein